jgi:hypothetical protein
VAAELTFLVVALLAFCALLGMRLHTRFLAARRGRISPVPSVRPFTPCVPVGEALDHQYGNLCTVQLEPLQLLNIAGYRGLPVSMFSSCYQRSLDVYPEIYEGSSFEQWLAYYTSAQLISLSGRRAYLTTEGRRVLKLQEVGRAQSPAA